MNIECRPFRVNCEYIYLLREREFVNMGAPIYKIGRSVSWMNRMNQYPKGSDIYLVVPVSDSVWYEKMLLDIFEERYEKATIDGEHQIGNEYFVGNLDEMIYIIQTFIQNHYPEHFVQPIDPEELMNTASDYTYDPYTSDYEED